METRKIEFTGYGIFLKQMRTDKGFRVEIDASQDEYKNLVEIPTLPEGLYSIKIEPIVE